MCRATVAPFNNGGCPKANVFFPRTLLTVRLFDMVGIMPEQEQTPGAPSPWLQYLGGSQYHADVRYTPPRKRTTRILTVIVSTIIILILAIILPLQLIGQAIPPKRVIAAGYTVSFPNSVSNVRPWSTSNGYTGYKSALNKQAVYALVTYPSYKVGGGVLLPSTGVSANSISRYLLSQGPGPGRVLLQAALQPTMVVTRITNDNVRGLAAIKASGHLTPSGAQRLGWTSEKPVQQVLVSYGGDILGLLSGGNTPRGQQDFVKSFRLRGPSNLVNRASTPALAVQAMVMYRNPLPYKPTIAPPASVPASTARWVTDQQSILGTLNARVNAITVSYNMLKIAAAAASPNTQTFYATNMSAACVSLHTTMGQLLGRGPMPNAAKQAALSAALSAMVKNSQECASAFTTSGSPSAVLSNVQAIMAAGSQLQKLMSGLGVSWVSIQ